MRAATSALTQLGRIEFAQFGGRDGTGGQVATDFIDNSAGVDCSDHEVNIKILLGRAVAGRRTGRGRPQRPARRDDRRGRRAGAARQLRPGDRAGQRDGPGALAAAGAPPADRRTGAARRAGPGAGGPAQRRGAGRPRRPRPRPDHAGVRGAPGVRQDRAGAGDPRLRAARRAVDRSTSCATTSRRRCASATPRCMAEHPLRREIVTTVLVNEAVNRGGTSFFYRATDETGASWADVLRAYVVVREIYGLRELWAATEALDNKVPTAAQTLVYLEAPPAARPVGALAGVEPALADRRAGRDRADAARASTRCCRGCDSLFRGSERESLQPARRGDDRRRACRPTWPSGPPGSCTGSGCSTSSRWRTTTGQPLEDVAQVYFVHLRAVPRRRPALADLRAAARGPLADAGPDGAAVRPVRGARRRSPTRW